MIIVEPHHGDMALLTIETAAGDIRTMADKAVERDGVVKVYRDNTCTTEFDASLSTEGGMVVGLAVKRAVKYGETMEV